MMTMMINDLELLNRNPKLFISSYFDHLVNQIDLNAETILLSLQTKRRHNENNSNNNNDDDQLIIDVKKIKRLVNSIRESQIAELKRQEKSYQDRLNVADYAFASEEERRTNLARFEALKSSSTNSTAEIENELNRLKRAYFENRCYSFFRINEATLMNILLKFDNIYLTDVELKCIELLLSTKSSDENDNDYFEGDLVKRISILLNAGHIAGGVDNVKEAADANNNNNNKNSNKIEWKITKRILNIYSIVNHLNRFKNVTLTYESTQLSYNEFIHKFWPILTFKEDEEQHQLILVESNRLDIAESFSKVEISSSFDAHIAIASDAFVNFHHLTQLIINDCLIEQIESSWFTQTGNCLRHLWLGNNRIRQIRSNDLENLSQLISLSLRNNRIDDIEPNAFKSLRLLSKLDLSHNKLKSIINISSPNCLMELQHLNLAHNRIDSIAKTMATTPMNLDENSSILAVDNSKLRILDLSHNRIVTIASSNAFKQLSRLEYFYLNHNQIKHLHADQFINQSKLVHLDLSNNLIEQLSPPVFRGLFNLEWLYVSNNPAKLKFRKEDLIDSKNLRNKLLQSNY